MAQQTAVEWLAEQINPNMKTMQGHIIQDLLEQAKQMEKEQIEKAYTKRVFSILEWRKEEHYYEETYGK